ncbi:hypothetical protein [Undibacterium sp. TS12]|uniref:hypothetical protein n=1 Tax=Undibacterium sp. TS12 TaxID=2908202 RepID=UPI001F4CDE05|nr:hypothetical protein [Undibacterium sp. TS12]MCH8622565.1 hypothetical protein [Undibacterium sp. TS12]
MKFTSICIKCGSQKKWFKDRCPSCSFLPEEKIDIAKSLMLSISFEIQSNEYGNEYAAKTWQELLEIGKHIAKSGNYEFDQYLLKKAEDEITSLENLSPKAVLKSVVIWLAPVLVVIFGFILYVIWQFFKV